MRQRFPTALRAQFRRHRGPIDLSRLPELPDFLRGIAPTCPVPTPSPTSGRAGAEPVVTTSMREVLAVVTRLARNGAAMPNNPGLGALAGGRGRSSVLRALRRLAKAGMIAIEIQGSFRRVSVLATATTTTWGEARPGHSPYLHHRPGEKPPPREKKARRPNTRPVAPQIPAEIASRYRAPLVHTCAATCQWPMWPDGERPGREPMFCGGSTVPDGNFCDTHMSLAYRTKPKPRPASTGMGKTPSILHDPRYRSAIVAVT